MKSRLKIDKLSQGDIIEGDGESGDFISTIFTRKKRKLAIAYYTKFKTFEYVADNHFKIKTLKIFLILCNLIAGWEALTCKMLSTVYQSM